MYGNASGSSPDHSHCTAPVHKNETCGGKGKARQLEQSKVLKLWGANPHHVLALITQTQLNDQLACRSYITKEIVIKYILVTFDFFYLENIMNEDDLRLIRRSTRSAEVNTRQKKMPKKRGTLQRQKARSELFENKNINYQKHMREF